MGDEARTTFRELLGFRVEFVEEATHTGRMRRMERPRNGREQVNSIKRGVNEGLNWADGGLARKMTLGRMIQG